MEWRSFLGVVTARNRLYQQHDDDDDDGDGDDRLITKDAKLVLINTDCKLHEEKRQPGQSRHK
jgi:hypothetical protein